MLSSLSGSHEEEDPSDHHHRHHHHHHRQHRFDQNQVLPPQPRSFASPAAHLRQLLINCAELVSQEDFAAAHRLISVLSSTSSPYGDSTDRLVHQFTRALSIRLDRFKTFRRNFVLSSSFSSSSSSPATTTFVIPSSSSSSTSGPFAPEIQALQFQSSFISLNQVTPFIRFSHLTANQAILEAVEGQQSIHILDFDTMQGVQWPPLMQAIAGRSDPSNPPMIRITGTGQDLDTLRRTGDRLENFAQSLGLRFQFHPLKLLSDPSSVALDLRSAIALLPDETLAVNCVLYLHRLLRDDSRDVRLFLRTVKAMNPKVVTVAEREANHNNPIFLHRFVEALDHYTGLFDSLEATLPPNSRERLAVEQVWFGKEIVDIVSAEGDERRERHERFESWVEKMTSSGFSNVPLSPFALSQAKLLLRLHYPSEGYQLQILNDTFFLGWQNQALFSVSSWH